MSDEGDLKVLTYSEARKFYDRFGSKQDQQSFYEQAAIDELCAAADFQSSRAVLELGCGTGKLAARLLAQELNEDARYVGLDLSRTMVGLTRERVASFGSRVEVRQTDGEPSIDAENETFDRFLACYVLDLLSPQDIRAVFEEAARVLEPGGLLCTAGLTVGNSFTSRAVSRSWAWLQAKTPTLVGGCRPIEAAALLPAANWRVREQRVVSAFSVPSEVLVAERTESKLTTISASPAPARGTVIR